MIINILGSTSASQKRKTKKEYVQFDSTKISNIGKVGYCIADLNLLSKGMKAYDTTNLEYRVMKGIVREQMEVRSLNWQFVKKDLTRRITLSIKTEKHNKKDFVDSLSYATHELCQERDFKYLVVFYGYSNFQRKGVASKTMAKAAGITTLGTLLGILTGTYIIAYPTGQDDISLFELYCSIYNVENNQPVFHSFESITSENVDNLREQIKSLYLNTFDNLTSNVFSNKRLNKFRYPYIYKNYKKVKISKIGSGILSLDNFSLRLKMSNRKVKEILVENIINHKIIRSSHTLLIYTKENKYRVIFSDFFECIEAGDVLNQICNLN